MGIEQNELIENILMLCFGFGFMFFRNVLADLLTEGKKKSNIYLNIYRGNEKNETNRLKIFIFIFSAAWITAYAYKIWKAIV